MTYQFGKAVFGGAPVSDDLVREMEIERLQTLWRQLKRPEPTDDPLDRRLVEELTYARRLLEVVEAELKRRGLSGALGSLAEAETVIGDIAGVVDAKDRCEGVVRASEPVKRRLLRQPVEGAEPICRAPPRRAR